MARTSKYNYSKAKRIRGVVAGQLEPNSSKEWAILHAAEKKQNTSKITILRANAAINKPSTMAGKIVVVTKM